MWAALRHAEGTHVHVTQPALTTCCLHSTFLAVQQAGRGHLKQLLADLEGEQARAAELAAALASAQTRMTAAEGAAEVAEARLTRAQQQVAAANETLAALEDREKHLTVQLEVRPCSQCWCEGTGMHHIEQAVLGRLAPEQARCKHAHSPAQGTHARVHPIAWSRSAMRRSRT